MFDIMVGDEIIYRLYFVDYQELIIIYSLNVYYNIGNRLQVTIESALFSANILLSSFVLIAIWYVNDIVLTIIVFFRPYAYCCLPAGHRKPNALLINRSKSTKSID